MQIVIDIPEDDYQRICEMKLPSYGAITYIIHRAFKYIKNGLPLPKGHGRLIDADALKKDDEVTEWLSLDAVRTGKMLKSFSELFIKKIDMQPTIIEKDKE